ncbi:MAG: hypothetical protein Q8K71_01830 [Polaromonas sp.]|uniref:hypothetical protein n=1 Tax=Polaromonas sp. TaxID=1869339 RepID=UPI0027318474|nr:hypothetical protein [Polaromonas sp.]MDP1740163.1 hypothetical protein [Polaromonas sp.]MDP1953195.1 hypothetical protein [Polaromonas sp.]
MGILPSAQERDARKRPQFCLAEFIPQVNLDDNRVASGYAERLPDRLFILETFS